MRGLQQIDDVAKYIPGLSLAQREPGGTTIVFRGVASSGIQFGAVSSSALYLDEQPITQSGRSPDPRFIDIERIEALRGPQGTLYGASSQSGTLRVITAKPDPVRLRCLGGSAGYRHRGRRDWLRRQRDGEHPARRGPHLVAPRRLRRRGRRLHRQCPPSARSSPGCRAGTFDNSNVVEEDVNSIETTGARAALRFDISENVDATIGVLYQDLAANGHSDMSEGFGDLNQVRFEDESLDDEWYQAALDGERRAALRRPRGRGVLLRPQIRLQADATDYEFSVPAERLLRDLRLRRRPARLRDEPREHAHHDRRGAAAVEQRRREPLVLARRRLLQPRGRAHVL